ncbi:MAG: phage N-6-adenine-methyltransferase [Bacteroidales bacterium]|nr:phage N-6-adenine-methyltransferase [Bacteroidales bacterium]
MAKANIIFTKDNEYYTPKKFVERFGVFDYDPATTKEKAEELGINNYDTIETDGLAQDWTPYRRIWINPPFTLKHKFMEKAWQTYLVAKNDIFILFPIEFLTTQRFHNSVGGGKLYVPNGRINFESGLGKQGKSPAFGSVVMMLQDFWEIILIPKEAKSVQ